MVSLGMIIHQLETSRLVLRQWHKKDWAPFAQINADPEVMRYFPAPLTPSESNDMADKIYSLLNQRGWGFWAIELKENHTFIGFTGLHTPSESLPFSPCIEIGWRLDKHYWNNGYATEAAQVVLEFAFTELELAEIFAFTTVGNVASRRVMEKLGMKNTQKNFAHPDIPIDNKLSEHVLYRLSKRQWKNQFDKN